VKQDFDLGQYLSGGIENIIKDAIKAALQNPAETVFLVKYIKALKEAARRRQTLESEGEHIPPFLIASITSECNLHCTGCYAHANVHGRADGTDDNTETEMSRSEWGRVFSEARDLGVAMILLGGGEPLMRRDIIEEAAKHPEIIFPVFSNGTMMDDGYLQLFDKRRNLVPIISIEGDAELTDSRRGNGVYAQTMAAMQKFQGKGILFGVSITVTTQNVAAVTGSEFLEGLRNTGCNIVVFVEYVPVERRDLALDPEQREYLQAKLDILRKCNDGMILISFPGDEKYSGGCLAAGRGFFHINATGGAEPCPFSPYSDTSLKDVSLRNALQSPLFIHLRESALLMQDHDGGCVLFEQADVVEQLVNTAGSVRQESERDLPDKECRK
jgi:MoaA/NifB/PqqE/SkfB family radical SAM enzyme